MILRSTVKNINRFLILLSGFLWVLISSLATASVSNNLYQHCDGSSDFNIHFSSVKGEAIVAVSTSQIIINASYIKTNSNYIFYFKSTRDLGRGGMMQSWSDFDKSEPIFNLVLDNNETYTVNWHGFWNGKTKKYDLAEKFFGKNNMSWLVYQCKFDK